MWKTNFLNMSKSPGKVFHLLVPSIFSLFILSVGSVVINNYMPHESSQLHLKEMLMNLFYMIGLIYGQGVVNTFYIENCFDNTSIEIRPVLRTFGMRARNYWIGQFISDYVLFLLTIPLYAFYIFYFNIAALV